MVKACLECGKKFVTGKSEYSKKHMIYCSELCGKKYRQKVKDSERLHKVICSECGIEFETTRANKVCCGQECVKARNRRRSREVGEIYRIKYREKKKKAKEKAPKEEAWKIEAEARKVGMNYGMYYAMREMEKERAKRLRGTA